MLTDRKVSELISKSLAGKLSEQELAEVAGHLDDGELGTKLSLQRTAELESVLTQTLDGEVVGTPLYMAPEQAAGELENLDEKTDVYGLGAILSAILTGCAPHESSNTSQDGRVRVSDLLQSIAVVDAPSPRDLNASVPADLASICTKAMSRRRHGRHRSANELANELANEVERWLAGQHEKQTQYDTLRMEGRELRATVDGTIRDIGRNTRFMANLPPIQGIIGARCGSSDETESVRRERLTTIFMGLLRANTDYSAVSYCQVVGGCDDVRDKTGEKKNSVGRVKEVVRVERHSTDLGNLRSVPASRLANIELESWSKSVVDQQPEEVFTDLSQKVGTNSSSGSSSSGSSSGTHSPRVLAAGVPVFDAASEEIFGYVRIECDLDSILDDQVRARENSASHVLVVDQADNVWSHHCREKGRLLTSCGRPMKEFVQCFQAVHTALGDANEYLDDTNHDVYATKIELVSGVSWLTLILGNRRRRSH